MGLDKFKGNYSQAYIPGLVTALTGLRYDPCLLSVGGVGGLLGAALIPVLYLCRALVADQ